MGHKQRHRFTNACFSEKQNIFDELALRLHSEIPFKERAFPWVIAYDIESYFHRSLETRANTSIECSHEILSVSVSSNIEDDICFVTDGNSYELVHKMVLHLEYLTNIAFEKSLIYYKRIITLLDEAMQNNLEPSFQEHDFPKCHPNNYAKNSITNLKQRFLEHIKVVPVVGFNSGKYDMNVFKSELLSILLNCDQIGHVIKDGNNFKCLQTTRYRFPDCCQFIAPGYDYRSYLKSFNCNLEKGYFPYEYIDSLDKLDEMVFPSRQNFFSGLSKELISDADYYQTITI